MKRTLVGLVLFGVVSIALGRTPRPQNEPGATQDMKEAGHDVKQAAKKTGSAVEKTAKKTGSAVEKTTKKGVHKSADEVKKGAAKVEGKTEPQQ